MPRKQLPINYISAAGTTVAASVCVQMNALLAIVITAGLVIACCVSSAFAYFDFTWALVGLTSVWAALDAKRIGAYRYKSGISGRPAVVFSICYLFWIFLFPYYLWLRFRIKRGTAEFKDEEVPSLAQRSAKTLSRRFSSVTEWLAGWGLIGIATLKIGLLTFCIEENWRGQRMWENCRQEYEAKGQSLDWDTMIPPAVPDSQNFYSAPRMSAWFVQPSAKIKTTDDIAGRLRYPNSSAQTVIVKIKCVPPTTGSHAEETPGTLKFSDPQSSAQARKLIQSAIGPYAFGCQGLTLLAQPLNTKQFRPPLIRVETDKKLDGKDLISFFFEGFPSPGSLVFKADGTDSWLVLTSFCPASNYLKWSGQFDRDFSLMREAAKRPYARIEGDYSFPPSMPVPNFTTIRAVSQTLAQRAQCFMLLNQPTNALQELTLLDTLRSKLEGAPTGKPMSLVSAMINVAVAGLYVETLQDGIRLQVWKAPQLAKLEEQLSQINLGVPLKQSFHEEQASSARVVDVLMHNLEIKRDPNASLLQMMKNLRPPNIARGFFDFNEVTIVALYQTIADSIDTSNETVSVSKTAEFKREDAKLDHPRFWEMPYTLYAEIVVPNFTKAVQTCAFDQTKVNEAEIACAVERYRVDHGNAPGSLNDLVPRYMGKLPHDIINGQPLKYSKTPDGGYQLYSIGWNQIDDGGQASYSVDQGDWVWQ